MKLKFANGVPGARYFALDSRPDVMVCRSGEVGTLILVRRSIYPNQIAHIAEPFNEINPTGGEITPVQGEFVESVHAHGDDCGVRVRPLRWRATQTWRGVFAKNHPVLRSPPVVIAHRATVVEEDSFDSVQSIQIHARFLPEFVIVEQ